MGSTGGKKKSKYKTFSSEHIGTHEYESDGGETNKWFLEHSNAKELYRGLDEDDGWAFDKWTEGYFMDGTQYDGFSNMTSREQEWVKTYDDYIDRSTIDTPLVVHRRATAELLFGGGHTHTTEQELRSIMGQDIICKGNLSTGAAAEGLTIGSHKDIEYEIRIPAGTGYGLWLGNRAINGYWGDQQREFMMSRDLIYRPVAYEVTGGDGHSRGDAKYKVILEVVGKMEHDYS